MGLIKSPEHNSATQPICYGTNLFRVLMTYFKPILPILAENVESFLNCRLNWETLKTPLTHHRIQPFKPLLQRIELQEVVAMIGSIQTLGNTENKGKSTMSETSENSKTSLNTEKPEKAESSVNSESNLDPIRETIDINDFGKIDLRIAKIVHAESVPEAAKLLKLTLDIGPFGTRQVLQELKKRTSRQH